MHSNNSIRTQIVLHLSLHKISKNSKNWPQGSSGTRWITSYDSVGDFSSYILINLEWMHIICTQITQFILQIVLHLSSSQNFSKFWPDTADSVGLYGGVIAFFFFLHNHAMSSRLDIKTNMLRCLSICLSSYLHQLALCVCVCVCVKKEKIYNAIF